MNLALRALAWVGFDRYSSPSKWEVKSSPPAVKPPQSNRNPLHESQREFWKYSFGAGTAKETTCILSPLIEHSFHRSGKEMDGKHEKRHIHDSHN